MVSGVHWQVQRDRDIRKNGSSTWEGVMYATLHLENPLSKFWVGKSSNEFRRVLSVLQDPYVPQNVHSVKQLFRYATNIHKDKTQGYYNDFLGKENFNTVPWWMVILYILQLIFLTSLLIVHSIGYQSNNSDLQPHLPGGMETIPVQDAKLFCKRP